MPTTLPPLSKLESDPRYAALSAEDQDKLRKAYFERFVATQPEYAGLAPDNQQKLWEAVASRPPVFKSPDDPEVKFYKDLAEKAATGDEIAKAKLNREMAMRGFTKGTLIGSVATWTVETLEDIFNPSNTNSYRKYLWGPEADKIDRYVTMKVPEVSGGGVAGGKALGVIGSIAESIAIANVFAGTLAAPRGLAVPLGNALKGASAKVSKGLASTVANAAINGGAKATVEAALHKFVYSFGAETANALASGVGFTLSEVAKNAIQRPTDPMGIDQVAKSFGQNVAYDYAVWGIFGIAGRVFNIVRATFRPDYAKEAAQKVLDGVIKGDLESALKQIEALTPEAADYLRAFSAMKIASDLDLTNPLHRMQVFASIAGIEVVPDAASEIVVGGVKTPLQMYRLKDLITGAPITTDAVSATSVADIVAKRMGETKIALKPVGQQSLNLTKTIKIDPDAPKNSRFSWTMRNLEKVSKDQGTLMQLRYDNFIKSEKITINGNPLKAVVDDDALGLFRSEGTDKIIGIGKLTDNAAKPIEFVNKLDSDPNWVAFKERIRKSIEEKGVLPIPKTFESIKQKADFEDAVNEVLVKYLPKGDTIVDEETMEAIAKPTYMWRKYALGTTTVDPTKPLEAREVTAGFQFDNVESTQKLASLAYGTKLNDGSIADNIAIQNIIDTDGSRAFVLSQKNEAGTWRWLLDEDGIKPKIYHSLDEIREQALRTAMSQDRVSGVMMQDIISRTAGYKLFLPGQKLVEMGGTVSEGYTLALLDDPSMKVNRINPDGKVTYRILASKPTLKETFDAVPEIYGVIGNYYGGVSSVKAFYEAASPVLQITGRIYSGNDSDIVSFLEKHPQESLEPWFLSDADMGLKPLAEAAQYVSSESTLGATRPKMIYTEADRTFYLTPIDGGPTLMIAGRGQFSSTETMIKYMKSNDAVYNHLKRTFAREGKWVEVMPNGSIGVFDSKGLWRTFKSRKELNEFFNYDTFGGLQGTYRASDEELAIMHDLLGELENWKFSNALYVYQHPELFAQAKPVKAVEFPNLRRDKFTVETFTEFSYNGVNYKVDLSKQTPFGWELIFKPNKALEKYAAYLVKRFDVAPEIAPDGTWRVLIGARDTANDLVQQLTEGKALDKFSTAGNYRRFGSGIFGRFIAPGGTELPLDDTTAETFKEFYRGGASGAKRVESGLKKQARGLEFWVQSHVMPTSETLETGIRGGYSGLSESWKVIKSMKVAMRLKEVEINPLAAKIEGLLGDFNANELNAMMKILWLSPEAQVQAAENMGMQLTKKHFDAVAETRSFIERFLADNGITIDGKTVMSQTSEFNRAIHALGERAAGNEIGFSDIMDLYQKMNNAESVPMLVKVFSDTVRPDELVWYLSGDVDLKSFTQQMLNSVVTRKYLGAYRDTVAKLYFDLVEAKNLGLGDYMKGTEKFISDTIDQFLGHKDITYDLTEGTLRPAIEKLKQMSKDSEVLRKLGLFDALTDSDIASAIGNRMTRVTQGGNFFNVLRNSMQPYYMAGAVGVPQILRSQAWVARHPEYIDELVAAGRITEGFMESVKDQSALARFWAGWQRPLSNSEFVNRATVIHAGESLLDEYLPRLRSGLETEQSFLKNLGTDLFYENERKLLMHFVNAHEDKVAAYYLGTMWEEVTQFDYSPANQGLAMRGTLGKLFGKFMTQNTGAMALISRSVRANPGGWVKGLAPTLRLVATMAAIYEAFKAIGIKYDGFLMTKQFNVSGGPAYKMLNQALALTQGGDRADENAKALGKSMLQTLSLSYNLYHRGDLVSKFAQGGQYLNALYAAIGAPVRTDAQIEYLDSFIK